MQADLLLIVVILIFGVGAFFLGIFYFVWKVLVGLGRGLMRVCGGCQSSKRGPARRYRSHPVVCPMPECRKMEYRVANYCSRCGAPLPSAK